MDSPCNIVNRELGGVSGISFFCISAYIIRGCEI